MELHRGKSEKLMAKLMAVPADFTLAGISSLIEDAGLSGSAG
jgi:hypothetical protein